MIGPLWMPVSVAWWVSHLAAPGLVLTQQDLEADWLPEEVAQRFGLPAYEAQAASLRLPQLATLPLSCKDKVNLFQQAREAGHLQPNLPVEALAWLCQVNRESL